MQKSETKMKKRRRPELIQLPSVPTILKISEVPSGFSIMRINLPFTLTHLAHAGVEKAFIFAETGKSPMTILGEQNALLNQMKKEIIDKIIEKYPKLYKHVTLAIIAHIRYGSRSGHGQPFSPSYISDIPKLVETLEECGFSKVPLKFFSIPIKKPKVWVTFQRKQHYGGFIASQYGNRLYDEYSAKELVKIAQENPILQSLKCHICETRTATGKFNTCIIPNPTSGED